MHMVGTQMAVAIRQAPVAKATGGTRQTTRGMAMQTASSGVTTQSLIPAS